MLLGEVFADSGYDAAMRFEFLGDRKLANLWKLLEMARTFDRSGLFGLADFIARLGDLVQTQPREEQAATQPEQADVVRLMSIHQAKGLEFPVVFVPDLAARGGGSHSPVAVWEPSLGCVARPPKEEGEELPFPEFRLEAAASPRGYGGLARGHAHPLRCLHSGAGLPGPVRVVAGTVSSHEFVDGDAGRTLRPKNRPLPR